jgi:Zn-dependent alcohol dehydrogenase
MPTNTMAPFRAARACAAGTPSSRVMMRPPRRTRSAGAIWGAACCAAGRAAAGRAAGGAVWPATEAPRPMAASNAAAIPETASNVSIYIENPQPGGCGAAANFYALKTQYSPPNQQIAYHYTIFGHGLCATAGAKLMGASFIIGVESDPVRMEMSKRMGAHVVLDPKQCDVVAEIKKLTGGGADVAIEALGLQETFENCLRCLRPGGTLSSLGVYSGKLQVPYDAFAAGLGDYKIVTTLCPGGKERMRRLMSMVQSKRFDPTPLLTHSFRLDQIVEAYDVFGSRRDGCLKVAITP